MNVTLDQALREWFLTTFEKLDRLKTLEDRLTRAEILINRLIDSPLIPRCNVDGCSSVATHGGLTMTMYRCDEHINVRHYLSDPMIEFHYAGALREHLRTKDEHKD